MCIPVSTSIACGNNDPLPSTGIACIGINKIYAQQFVLGAAALPSPGYCPAICGVSYYTVATYDPAVVGIRKLYVVKSYKRKITSSMAYALIIISKSVNNSEFHLQDTAISLKLNTRMVADFPKLRFWGLINQHQGKREDGGSSKDLRC